MAGLLGVALLGMGVVFLDGDFFRLDLFLGGMILARERIQYGIRHVLGWNEKMAHLAGNQIVKKRREEVIGLNHGSG